MLESQPMVRIVFTACISKVSAKITKAAFDERLLL
jgi:hypothetical protein